MLISVTLLLAAAILGILAVAMGYVLGWADKAFEVKVDPKVEAVLAALPGSNCGGCGYVGCSDYAEAVAAGKAEPTLCAPGGSGASQKIGGILGVEVGDALPYRPVVHCSATWEQRLGRFEYLGEHTCSSANLVPGVQGCTYGCLGIGDCVRACKYDAIHVVDGLARVDYEKCIGCKACSKACPRKIITMVPFKSDRVLVVACSNLDFGPDVKKVCSTGCIGCKACSRKCELFTMNENLPVLNYDQYELEMDLGPVLEKCPMHSLVYVGKPTPEDKAAVKGEEVPALVKADFETTVDKTDWWG